MSQPSHESRANFSILPPMTQIGFAIKLKEIRDRYLDIALKDTVSSLDIARIDDELARFMKNERLQYLAQFGLRGEIAFPVPYVLTSNPYLLGYYRFLLGFSQKRFYNARLFGRFARLESKGVLPPELADDITPLCQSLIESVWLLLETLTTLSPSLVSDLQLLTVGPQLRGSMNTILGQTAEAAFFQTLKSFIDQHYITSEDSKRVTLINEQQEEVVISKGRDPDISVEGGVSNQHRKILAIEIKGGDDFANIHNRLGEAEKSHIVAREKGYEERWTVIAVEQIGRDEAKARTPSTTRLFHLPQLEDPNSEEYDEFNQALGEVLNIAPKKSLPV